MGNKLLITSIGLIIIAVGLVYFNINPTSSNLFPKCSFYVLTGLKCPGCGSQRTIHALLNGDIVAAWNYNAMLILAIPYLLILGYVEVMRKIKPQLYIKINSPIIVITTASIIILWWIFRNIFGW